MARRRPSVNVYAAMAMLACLIMVFGSVLTVLRILEYRDPHMKADPRPARVIPKGLPRPEPKAATAAPAPPMAPVGEETGIAPPGGAEAPPPPPAAKGQGPAAPPGGVREEEEQF